MRKSIRASSMSFPGKKGSPLGGHPTVVTEDVSGWRHGGCEALGQILRKVETTQASTVSGGFSASASDSVELFQKGRVPKPKKPSWTYLPNLCCLVRSFASSNFKLYNPKRS